MKNLILLTFLIVFGGAIYNLRYANVAPNPIHGSIGPTASPPVEDLITISNAAVRPDELNKIRKILEAAKSSDGEKEEAIQRRNSEVYRLAESLTIKSKLNDLETFRFADSYKEVRIWEVGSLFSSTTKGYIFIFSDGKWKAFSIVETEDRHLLKRIAINPPADGWQMWETFIEREISPNKVKNYSTRPGGTDALMVVIEVKFGNEYAKNIFYDSAEHPVLQRIYEMICRLGVGPA